MDELLKKALDQGGLFAVLVIGLALFSRIGWWVARQLLEPSKNGRPAGHLVCWFEAQQKFLDGLQKRDELQTRVCGENTELLHTINENTTAGRNEVRKAAGPFEQTMIDLARARVLELDINPNMTDEEAAQVRAKVTGCLHAIQQRHEASMERRSAAS